MVRIAISVEAFAAIVATMPLGTVAFEQEIDTNGQRYVWVEVAVADRLGALRRRGEGHSDVILRIARREGPSCWQRPSRLGPAPCDSWGCELGTRVFARFSDGRRQSAASESSR